VGRRAGGDEIVLFIIGLTPYCYWVVLFIIGLALFLIGLVMFIVDPVLFIANPVLLIYSDLRLGEHRVNSSIPDLKSLDIDILPLVSCLLWAVVLWTQQPTVAIDI